MFDGNKKIFIIAEAGSNWRMGTPKRDMEMAKILIDSAVSAGADAVKFQTYRPETVYVPNAGGCDYLSSAGIKESIFDIFEDLSMPYDMIPELAEHCADKNIVFMSTPFSVKDAQQINPYVNVHKIASYEISHLRLIEYIAKTDKPLILSTGAASIEDIEWAIKVFRKSGGKQIALMQCVAKYPAPMNSLNLNVIPEMAKRFKIPVGYSDHSRNPIIAPVTAVALGAKIIEKHFTLNNRLPGPDHAFAVTAEELKDMVTAIRLVEQTFGNSKKEVQEVENELKFYAQRSLQATKNISIGERFKEGENFDILRSGNRKQGLHPKYIKKIIGKKALRNIMVGDGINTEDYK